MPIYTLMLKKKDIPNDLISEAMQGRVVFFTFLTPIIKNDINRYENQKALLCKELTIPLSFINSQPVVVSLPMSASLLDSLLIRENLLEYKTTIQAIRGVRHSSAIPPKCSIDLDLTEVFAGLYNISDWTEKDKYIKIFIAEIESLLQQTSGIETIKEKYPDVYGMAKLFQIIELKLCGYYEQNIYEDNLRRKNETYGKQSPQYLEYKNEFNRMWNMAARNTQIIGTIIKVSDRIREEEERIKRDIYESIEITPITGPVQQISFLETENSFTKQ